jgi:ligand-binding sensor domain-containing protein/signal transduction histidine kinase
MSPDECEMMGNVFKGRFTNGSCILLGLLIGSVLPARSEAPADDYQFEVWKTERGLPQNTVLSLRQTREGYLWIGTRFGLARFDGVHFITFNLANTAEMLSENCGTLAEDNEGNLWVGTNNGLLRRAGNRFQCFTTADGLCHNEIRSLVPSREGGVWVGTSQGLSRFKDGRFVNYDDLTGPIDVRLEVLEDRGGAVWFTTEKGLHRLWPASRRLELIAPAAQSAGTRALCLLEGSDHRIWLGNYTGLHCWEAGKIKSFVPGEAQGPAKPGATKVDVVFQSSAGDVWVALSAKRLLHVFRNGRFIPFTWPTGEGIDAVQCFTEDREGNIWIGTEFEGLIRLQRRFISMFTTRQGLGADNVWTVCEDADGAIWTGVAEGSISRIRGQEVSTHLIAGCSGYDVFSILADRSNTVWVGLKKSPPDKSLFQFRSGEFVNFNTQAGISSGAVQALLQDRAGNIWIGTHDGVTRWRGGQIDHFTTEKGLAHNDVRAILEDRAGDMWFGTYRGGICRLRAGQFTTFDARHGLSSDMAWTLHEDSDGVLWIGTRSGLNRFKDGKFFVFKTQQGLFDDLVNRMLEDDHGFFWISCNRGIYRVSRAEMNAVAEGRETAVQHISYGAADGMASSETNGENQPAGCKTRDGRLWFPTIQGLAVINPSQVPTNEVAPPVVIEQVIADDQLVYDNGVDVAGLPWEPRAALSPGRARVLQIHFTANSFMAPEKMKFKYRLRGHHEEWRFAGRDRVAYYTSLRPGKYQFEVTACNNHGKWNPSPAVFAISLAPHFYQTVSFYIACGLAAVGTGFGAHQLRVRFLRRLQRLEKFQAIELERARIAKDMHDDLGSSLTQISLMSELATRNGDDSEKLKGHLQEIGQSTRSVLQSLEEIVWATNPRHDTLEGLVSFLGKYASDFLRPAAIACRLDLPPLLPPVPISTQVRHNLLLVMKEALTNVVKHAGATEVWVRAEWLDPVLEIVIEDNGKGLRASEADPHSDGLRNMNHRLSSLGGSFAIDAGAGRGTRVKMRVPVVETRVGI